MNSISQFLRKHYSDNNLVALLAAAKRGRVGFANPRLCLLGRSDRGYDVHNHISASKDVELLFKELGEHEGSPHSDPLANKKLIPLIEAEIARRARAMMKRAEIDRPVAVAR